MTDGGITVTLATVGINHRISFEIEEEARQRWRAPLKLVPGDTQTRASWAGFHMSVTLGRRRKRSGICMGWGHSTFSDL